MGLALAAELNGYPGPIHVLELAEPLGLTEDQRSRVQALHAAMKAEAVPLGERLIGQEADLEAAFRERTVTRANLAEKTAAIAATQGALRHAHQVPPRDGRDPEPGAGRPLRNPARLCPPVAAALEPGATGREGPRLSPARGSSAPRVGTGGAAGTRVRHIE